MIVLEPGRSKQAVIQSFQTKHFKFTSYIRLSGTQLISELRSSSIGLFGVPWNPHKQMCEQNNSSTRISIQQSRPASCVCTWHWDPVCCMLQLTAGFQDVMKQHLLALDLLHPCSFRHHTALMQQNCVLQPKAMVVSSMESKCGTHAVLCVGNLLTGSNGTLKEFHEQSITQRRHRSSPGMRQRPLLCIQCAVMRAEGCFKFCRAHISRAWKAQQHHAEQRQAGGGHGAHEDGAAGVHHPVLGGHQ